MTTMKGMSPRAVRAAGLIAAAAGLLAGAGCARSRPVATPPPVALNMPPPPSRVISTPPEPVAPVEATSMDRPAPATRPARTTRPAAARTEPARAAEAAPVETPAETPTPVEAPPPAGPLLRTPQTADEAQADRRIREVLDRASALLGRVDPLRLGQQARQQHETAHRFVEQAKQALLERNFVLATNLADKAETLAKGLSR